LYRRIPLEFYVVKMYEMERLIPAFNIDPVSRVYGMSKLIPPFEDVQTSNVFKTDETQCVDLDAVFDTVHKRLKNLVLDVEEFKKKCHVFTKSNSLRLVTDVGAPCLLSVHCDPKAFPRSIFYILDDLSNMGFHTSLQFFKHSSLLDTDVPRDLQRDLQEASVRHSADSPDVFVCIRVVLLRLSTSECQIVTNPFNECNLIGETMLLRVLMLALGVYNADFVENVFMILDEALIGKDRLNQLPEKCDPSIWPFVRAYIRSLWKVFPNNLSTKHPLIMEALL
jgi:hypothetical protein